MHGPGGVFSGGWFRTGVTREEFIGRGVRRECEGNGVGGDRRGRGKLAVADARNRAASSGVASDNDCSITISVSAKSSSDMRSSMLDVTPCDVTSDECNGMQGVVCDAWLAIEIGIAFGSFRGT